MKALVLGSGGREHALAWKLSQTLGSGQVWLHPGNPGALSEGLRPLAVTGTESSPLAAAAKQEGISLVVIGPEAMLASGLADELRKEGLLVVGPGTQGTELESSKIFAKEFMKRANVPTADYEILDSREALESHSPKSWPTVYKLDGLAAGKGVVIAQSQEALGAFAERIWDKQEFGSGPHRILVEEFIKGHEMSFMGLCDGKNFVPLSTATDYKRAGDGDTGDNTGGMGSISPSPYFNEVLEKKIQESIVNPVLAQLQKDSIEFRGVLYIGLMITSDGDPYVLEFNTRFGDPETQAVLMRLQSPLEQALEHTARGTLDTCPPLDWSSDTSLYVVSAAFGYPKSPRMGDAIRGLENVPNSVQVFFAGVKQGNDGLETSGGRVLGLGALGSDAESVRREVYGAMEQIHWNGMQFRKDIGLF